MIDTRSLTNAFPYVILEDELVYFKKVVIVMSVLDDCDIEYSVETDLSDDKFYERGKERSTNSWGLKVARKIVMSSKTLRALRKHGFISRKEKIWLVSSSPVLCCTLAITSFVCALISFIIMTATMTVWSSLLSLAFVGVGTAAVIVGSTQGIILKKIKDRVDEQLNTKSASRIELHWGELDLYEIAKSLSKSHDGDAVKLKKTLFELLSEYPAEVNERINELYKTKKSIPEEVEGREMVLSDVDKLLEKLFRMRDSSENLQIVNQVRHVLRESARRKKMEQMGISVEKLSQIADFLNKAEQEKKIPEPKRNNEELSALVSEMNNVDVEYETVEKDTRRTEVKHLV